MSVIVNFLAKIIPQKKIIFIVEDNDVYAKSLQTFLKKHFPEIKEIMIFSIGEVCLTEMYRKPIIVIVDYFLNSKFVSAYNGIEIIKRIKAQIPQTEIIVLSSHEQATVISAEIERYNCSYLQKDADAFSNIEHLVKKIIKNKKSPTLAPVN